MGISHAVSCWVLHGGLHSFFAETVGLPCKMEVNAPCQSK